MWLLNKPVGHLEKWGELALTWVLAKMWKVFQISMLHVLCHPPFFHTCSRHTSLTSLSSSTRLAAIPSPSLIDATFKATTWQDKGPIKESIEDMINELTGASRINKSVGVHILQQQQQQPRRQEAHRRSTLFLTVCGKIAWKDQMYGWSQQGFCDVWVSACTYMHSLKRAVGFPVPSFNLRCGDDSCLNSQIHKCLSQSFTLDFHQILDLKALNVIITHPQCICANITSGQGKPWCAPRNCIKGALLQIDRNTLDLTMVPAKKMSSNAFQNDTLCPQTCKSECWPLLECTYKLSLQLWIVPICKEHCEPDL